MQWFFEMGALTVSVAVTGFVTVLLLKSFATMLIVSSVTTVARACSSSCRAALRFDAPPPIVTSEGHTDGAGTRRGL